ncbi:MAG: polyprenyl synthetase family protein, partial [Actinomycetota bacterium]
MTSLSGDDLNVEIERSLTAVLDRAAKELPEAKPLLDAIREMLASGGKRLRPAFCYWGYRATGAPHCDEIVAAAASLELLHSFALIHDDVMDMAEIRRGRPTINTSLGDPFAILAGDLALILADDAFVNSGFSQDRVVRAFGAYSRMRQEVIAGQLLDITAAARTQTVTDARRMALLKSGRYTVSEPLVIGCLFGGSASELQTALSSIGD